MLSDRIIFLVFECSLTGLSTWLLNVPWRIIFLVFYSSLNGLHGFSQKFTLYLNVIWQDYLLGIWMFSDRIIFTAYLSIIVFVARVVHRTNPHVHKNLLNSVFIHLKSDVATGSLEHDLQDLNIQLFFYKLHAHLFWYSTYQMIWFSTTTGFRVIQYSYINKSIHMNCILITNY